MTHQLKKLYIRTLGCQMNEYDSDKIAQLLAHSHNMQLIDNELEADVLVINTCSIRQKAEEKLFHQLGRWRKLKAKKNNTIIAVGGCVASQEGGQIFKRAPYVDIIFGPQTLHRLPKMLTSVIDNKKVSIDVSFTAIEKFDHLPKPNTNKVSAYVSIMEGCSKYCSFCIVPYTRGEEVSRNFDDVINEVAILAKQNVIEINLLGQNVNNYQGLMNDGNTADLALLISIVAKVPGIKRIRFTTSHPLEFSDRLIQTYAEVPELMSHLHLPIQSGADKILNLMKRGHTALEYKSKIKKLKQIRPNISLSSDFIIGFPGENEKDFNDTINIIKEIGFDRSFSFIYSARPGTPAASYTDDTSMDVKKKRLAIVQDIISQNTNKITRSMIGSVQKILVEGMDKKIKSFCGRTENMRNTYFKGDKSLIGKIVNIKINSGKGNSLVGELVN